MGMYLLFFAELVCFSSHERFSCFIG